MALDLERFYRVDRIEVEVDSRRKFLSRSENVQDLAPESEFSRNAHLRHFRISKVGKLLRKLRRLDLLHTAEREDKGFEKLRIRNRSDKGTLAHQENAGLRRGGKNPVGRRHLRKDARPLSKNRSAFRDRPVRGRCPRRKIVNLGGIPKRGLQIGLDFAQIPLRRSDDDEIKRRRVEFLSFPRIPPCRVVLHRAQNLAADALYDGSGEETCRRALKAFKGD